MIRRLLVCGWCVAALVVICDTADAQTVSDIGVRGFGLFGNITFVAEDSFKAILDRNSGPIFGGGAQLLLPWNVYIEVGASRFSQSGERVFVTANNEVFKLGIPLDVKITPIELTAGYRFAQLGGRVVPYAGGGYSSYRYEETSEGADPGENVDERFAGFHLLGGAEFQVQRWLAIGGEVAWSSIADAIGKAGVSEHYNEDNLGGTSFRVKVSVGR